MSLPSIVRAPVRRSPLFMGFVGAFALVLAIANSAASVGFPVGFLTERVINALVTIDLLVVFIVLLVVVLVGARKDAAVGPATTVIDQRGADAAPPRTGPGILAPLGLALVAVDWVLWLVFGFPGVLHSVLTQQSGYLLGAIPIALFAPLLVLGTVFAVTGFHRGGSRANRLVSLGGTALGLLMMAVAAATAMLCAMGVLG